MILTPIAPQNLPRLFAEFSECLAGNVTARACFDRITAAGLTSPRDEEDLHAQAVALCLRAGLPVIDEEPLKAFSWDGAAVRIRSEPSVLIHEVAHYQVCAPARRFLPDFGLGAGPETGHREQADAALALTGAAREMEEALASLLGILWEAELGQPAVAAFLEQNWMEGGASPRNRDHFLRVVTALRLIGLLDADGRPQLVLRVAADSEFFAVLGIV